MKKFEKRYLIDAGIIIIISFFLEYIYFSYICKYFAHHRYYFEFNSLRYIVAKFILVAGVFINLFQKKMNYLVSTLLIVLMLIPNLILYEFKPETPLIISFFVFITILFLYLSSLISIKTTKINFTNNYKILTIAIISLLAFIPLVLTYKFDIHFKVLLFENIYQVRAESAKKMGHIVAYLYPWLAKIIFPLALFLSLKYKNKLLFILILFAQIYLFLVQGQKSVFVSIFLLVFYFFKTYQKQTRVILYGIILVIVSTHLLTLLTNDIFPESIFIRRVFFVPALDNIYYFDFFKGNHLYYSYGILKSFIHYPYPLQPQYMIGKIYYNAPNMSVNNGFISGGFMNMGIPGVLLNILGITIYFKILDKINISPIFSGIIIIIVFTLISSYFFTSLLTHGLILFLLLSFFIIKDTGIEYSK